MAELSLQEKLQPSLLDRLTDNEPESKVESRAQRVLSLNRLKRSVLRDLAWLLNSGNLAMTEDLSPYPEVTNSVVNYGVTDLAGTTATSTDTRVVEREIKQAILDFEPRILPESLSVKVSLSDQHMSNRTLSFLIEGQLWAQPLPVSLYLSTDLDLETGTTTVTETTG
ncbi:MAG: type VI secretion system baseplate subunit TssE [Woeseiaceae bacterium]|nr:type VI secretion system baseplate subunit TssE [Woeseiaceae bacterium]